ncbi:MAG TPA: methylated-DNA--[protein]-cysteine S-methyltransferase [Polyangiales bacterium]|nr:methylated-DNA--[protein]-cysteine S-methyltransferase [Polyangiales bacterium]
MAGQANTFEIARRKASVGQGLLELPGIGELRLAWSEKGLLLLELPNTAPEAGAQAMVDRGIEAPESMEVPAQYAECLLAYAAGEPVEPAQLPVDLYGTTFQLRVWGALRNIPRGSVRSYGGIATDLNNPRAVRAIGMANSVNPVAIVVPCHRVVESGLKLGGFAAGPSMKRKLLALEGVSVEAERVRPGQLELWDRFD